MLFSLRSRLMAVFSILLILPFAALAFFMSGAAATTIQHSIESSSMQTIDQFASHVGTLLTQIEDTGKQILSSTVTQEWLAVELNPESSIEERVQAKMKLRNSFSAHSVNNSNGISISAFLESGGGVWSQDRSYLQKEWYTEYIRRDIRWTRAHKDVDQPDDIMRSRHVNSMIYPMVQLQYLNRVGLIKVNYPTDLLQASIEKIRFGESGRVYLLTDAGRSVLNQDLTADRHVLEAGLSELKGPFSGEKSGIFPITREGGTFLLFFKKLPAQGWVIIGSVPEGELYRKITDIRRTMLGVALGLLMIAIVCAYVLSAGITRPLSMIARAMKHVKNGEFAQALKLAPSVKQGHSELNYVTGVFEQMTRQLQYLIETEFETNLRRKNAEYKALLLQINPHFYNNTLEIISGLAAMNRGDLVMDATEALGKMMRYSLNLNSDRVRLGEEIRYLRDYLFILKLRHEDRLELVLHEDPEADGLIITKFILQPLVENAVKYSLEKEGQARILLITEVQDDSLMILLRDNGIGMPEGLVADVLSGVHAPNQSAALLSSEGYSIGLRNVLARCNLNYGAQFKVEIRSQVGIGTEIILRLPKVRS